MGGAKVGGAERLGGAVALSSALRLAGADRARLPRSLAVAAAAIRAASTSRRDSGAMGPALLLALLSSLGAAKVGDANTNSVIESNTQAWPCERHCAR